MKKLWFSLALAFFGVNLSLCAEDIYLALRLKELTFPEGSWPLQNPPHRYYSLWQWMAPYVVLDGEGEAYVGPDAFWFNQLNVNWLEQRMAVRIPQDRDISGRLYIFKPDGNGLIPVQFKIPAGLSRSEKRSAFFTFKAAYYHRLLERRIPGAAWFRYQEQQALNALNANTNHWATDLSELNRFQQTGLDGSYDLFSGGRAVSENLQLDQGLNVTVTNTATHNFGSLPGVSVQALNWKALMQDKPPATDPLARCLPADQHALFFPSFQAMLDLMDQADFHGTPVLRMFESRAEDAHTRQFYQKQLCLDLSELSRLLGPYVIQSVAFTGSDPYLRTGSDVGIAYESKSPMVLKAFIMSKHTAARQADSAVKEVKGAVEGVAYTGVVSPSREVSSYVASVDKIVFVSNSLFQLGQLIKTAQGKIPSLAGLDEYRFFRQRYHRGDPEETAFLILTDAAIRRWCGPRWRILSARRTYVGAVMADLQAQYLGAAIQHQNPARRTFPLNLPDAGELVIGASGPVSSVYGTMAFMTPIAEIPSRQATDAEAEAYQQWRDLYEQYWRQYFDPIAVRFSMHGGGMKTDLSVLPLITRSSYREFIDITRGAAITPGAGERPTNVLVSLALALNKQSSLIKSLAGVVGPLADSPLRLNPLGWLGQTVVLYFDDNPYWDELRKSTNILEILSRECDKLPLAFWFEVKNPLGAAVFLTALRARIESSAPDMVTWQNIDYHGHTYVKFTSKHMGSRIWPESVNRTGIFYWISPESLLVTFNEPLLQRAIDCHAQQGKTPSQDLSTRPSLPPWLGQSLCLQADQRGLEAVGLLFKDLFLDTPRRSSWSNIPILNEWHRLYPGQDPVQVHEKYWQTKLVCPAGGSYVWNEPWQTMESTICGHPGQPQPIPPSHFSISDFAAVNFGITFENQGLRAQSVLERKKP